MLSKRVRILSPLLILLSSFSFFACKSSEKKASNEAITSTLMSVDTNRKLKEAYIYGYPLVLMETTRQKMTNVAKPTGPYAPMGQMGKNGRFADPSMRDVVRPNLDTFYSSTWADLSQGPVVLEMPASENRYYIMQMLDAWTNVFAAPTTRIDGGKAGTYVITGPGWTGEVPKDMEELKAPTNLIWIIGRTEVKGKKDEAAAKKAMAEYKLMPLAQWGQKYTPAKGKVNPKLSKASPDAQVAAMSTDQYFNLLNQLMVKNPPQPADAPLISRAATIGIGPGMHFETAKLSSDSQVYAQTLPQEGKREVLVEMGERRMVNGWVTGVDPEIGRYGTNYTKRAAVALGGLGANLNEDAIYPFTAVDADGQPLDGQNAYIIHFAKADLPPADIFWSLTVYGSDNYLVKNSMGRYALGSRDLMKRGDDGSLDILIQHDKPTERLQSNWLPTPAQGNFTLMLRLYGPKDNVIGGRWAPPGVRKVETGKAWSRL